MAASNARESETLGLKDPQEAMTLRFLRITVEADKMRGVPCIWALRMPMATVVAMVAEA